MRIRKVNSDGVKIHDSVQVKLKTAGNTSVVQFTAGNNKSCPVRNLSKDTYLDTLRSVGSQPLPCEKDGICSLQHCKYFSNQYREQHGTHIMQKTTVLERK